MANEKIETGERLKRNVPDDLKKIDRWVLWTQMERNGKLTKVPTSVDGQPINFLESSNRMPFDKAITDLADSVTATGIAFVFSEDDDLMGIDIDDCLRIDGLHTSIDDLVRRMDTYTEVSPSGRGLKLFMRGRKPNGRCTTTKIEGAARIEVFSEKRMFTVTGNHYSGTPRDIRGNQAEIEKACRQYLGGSTQRPVVHHDRHPQPLAELSAEDQQVVERAGASRRGETFRRLFDEGDLRGNRQDRSSGDQTLCNILADLCGPDGRDQVDRIFRRSALIRGKWDEKRGSTTYGWMTIDSAYRFITQGRAGTASRHLDNDEVLQAAYDEGLLTRSMSLDDLVSNLPLGLDLNRLLETLRREKVVVRARGGEDGDDSDDLILSAGGDSDLVPILLGGEWSPHRLVAGDGRVFAWSDQERCFQKWENETCESLIHNTLKDRVFLDLHRRPASLSQFPNNWRLLKHVKPDNSMVREVLGALKREVHVKGIEDGDIWLPSRNRPEGWANQMSINYPPHEVVACRNTLLHVATGTKIVAAPHEFFHRAASTFDYDADAGEPKEWLKFLNAIFDGDTQTLATVKHMFGYILSGKTQFQKIFLLIGPPRSGKSTIVHRLEDLVGGHYAGLRSLSDLESNFALDGTERQKLLVFNDCRTDRNTKASARTTEHLLKISGGDRVNVNRKFRSPWEGALKTHILMVSNQVPTLTDQSRALASRLLVLKTRKSFEGQEDFRLEDRLRGELPAIFNWAMEGYNELAAQGRFVQPEAGRDELNQMAEVMSPVSAFVRECCDLGPTLRVSKADLYSTYQRWASDNGHHVVSSSEFGTNLMGAHNEIKNDQKTSGGGPRRTAYGGIGLRQLRPLSFALAPADDRPAA